MNLKRDRLYHSRTLSRHCKILDIFKVMIHNAAIIPFTLLKEVSDEEGVHS